MKISNHNSSEITPGVAGNKKPQTIEETAEQFETVLVRQLVKTMTEGLFRNSLSGEDGPAWMAGYADTQRDMLTDVLASHLVKSGKMKFSDLLLRQWQRTATPEESLINSEQE